jgi:hypothetical protein
VIEIILGVWLVCFCLSAIVTRFGYYLTYKKLTSQSLSNLNTNLKKIHLFWSNSSSDFTPLTEGAVEADAKKALRTSLLVGFLGVASVVGFILLFLVVISVHFLARSRKERATFRSALTDDTSLSAQEVEALVQDLRGIV